MTIGRWKLGFRGWWALFRKDWYSIYRWNNVQELEHWRLKIIDMGAFYISKSMKPTQEEQNKLKEDLGKLFRLQSELAKFPRSEDDWPEYIGYTGEEVE